MYKIDLDSRSCGLDGHVSSINVEFGLSSLQTHFDAAASHMPPRIPPLFVKVMHVTVYKVKNKVI